MTSSDGSSALFHMILRAKGSEKRAFQEVVSFSERSSRSRPLASIKRMGYNKGRDTHPTGYWS